MLIFSVQVCCRFQFKTQITPLIWNAQYNFKFCLCVGQIIELCSGRSGAAGGERELRTGHISSRNWPDSRRMFYISQEYIIITTLLHEYHGLTSVIEQWLTSNCGGDECKYRRVYKSEYFAQILQSGQNSEWLRKAAPQRQGRPLPAGGGTHGPHQSQVRYFYF